MGYKFTGDKHGIDNLIKFLYDIYLKDERVEKLKITGGSPEKGEDKKVPYEAMERDNI